MTSASMVGLPRLSRISRARTSSMLLMAGNFRGQKTPGGAPGLAGRPRLADTVVVGGEGEGASLRAPPRRALAWGSGNRGARPRGITRGLRQAVAAARAKAAPGPLAGRSAWPGPGLRGGRPGGGRVEARPVWPAASAGVRRTLLIVRRVIWLEGD